MAARIKVFLDTSALFSGAWSLTGGAHLILKLGEVHSLDIWLSPQVLSELEKALQEKAPELLGDMALLLDRARVQITRSCPAEQAKLYLPILSHPGDAQVIADAVSAGPDYFVTLDRKHFLENQDLQGRLPFPLGTPGDFLAWYRERLA